MCLSLSQMFCNILVHEAQFGYSRCFCQGHKGDSPYYTMGFQVYLILAVLIKFAFDSSIALKSVVFCLLDLATQAKISRIISLLYFNQLYLHLLHNLFFFFFFAQFKFVNHKFLNYVILHNFQITDSGKQWTICWCTNYPNTTKRSGYLFTASVTSYISHKLTCTKILQDFWLSLFIILYNLPSTQLLMCALNDEISFSCFIFKALRYLFFLKKDEVKKKKKSSLQLLKITLY